MKGEPTGSASSTRLASRRAALRAVAAQRPDGSDALRALPAFLGAALLAGALLGPSAAFAQDEAPAPSQKEPAREASSAETEAQLAELSQLVVLAREGVDLVENQYTLREPPGEAAAQQQRFSDAEVQYLLGDYSTASVLFYDLVASRDFQASARYADALYYLAEALYQQKNYLGARLYLRQLLALRRAHFKEGLTRYLEIASRLNEYTGIDGYLVQAQELYGATLPADLSYVYAKWLFRREDQPAAVRVPRAQELFRALEADPSGPYRLQSAYYVGVGFVRLRDYEKAIAQFSRVAQMPASNEVERTIQELVRLSMGRVHFELGAYDLAVDSYAYIPQASANFPEALYEIAWSYVRKGELAKAKNATDILLLVAEDSVLAPEARILQGMLLQKLRRYDDSVLTYRDVIASYSPVRDEIDELLAAHKDPVRYFDELLARNERSLDVTRLLPPVALRWASTQREVAEAQGLTGALDTSRASLKDSRAIVARILKSLDERGLESFPVLQDGYTRATAVENALSRIDERLIRLVEELAGPRLPAGKRQRLAEQRARVDALKQRIDALPATTDAVQERRRRMQARVDELDRAAFRAGMELQSQQAQLTAIRRYLDDTRAERSSTPEDEQAFRAKLDEEQKTVDATRAELEALRAGLVGERSNADLAVSGEDLLRREYAEQLAAQRALLDEARGAVGSAQLALLAKADVLHVDTQALLERVTRAKTVIRDRVRARADRLREQVLAEQRLLDAYEAEAEAVTGETRNLVGRIAFDSFQRVRQTFADLVLKADVGIVDVAFQRKQEKTSSIQRLAAQKEDELRSLQVEFQEVLKDTP